MYTSQVNGGARLKRTGPSAAEGRVRVPTEIILAIQASSHRGNHGRRNAAIIRGNGRVQAVRSPKERQRQEPEDVVPTHNASKIRVRRMPRLNLIVQTSRYFFGSPADCLFTTFQFSTRVYCNLTANRDQYVSILILCLRQHFPLL
jgi:hypothetical protein